MMEKKFCDMTYGEKISYVAGLLILSIGEGTFRNTVTLMYDLIQEEAYNRGLKEGLRREEARKTLKTSVKKVKSKTHGKR